jgi:hypothetical protein
MAFHLRKYFSCECGTSARIHGLLHILRVGDGMVHFFLNRQFQTGNRKRATPRTAILAGNPARPSLRQEARVERSIGSGWERDGLSSQLIAPV